MGRGRSPHPDVEAAMRAFAASVVLVAALCCAAVAVAVAAGAPFPSERAGSGTEPTRGNGRFGETAFTARSAVVQWDGRMRLLTLYVFERPAVRCDGLQRTIDVRRGRSIQVVVTRRRARLPIGRRIPPLFVRFVERHGATDAELQAVQLGALVRFSRVDTRPGGTWHGRLAIRPHRVARASYSYDGTFAATWCPS